MSLWTLQMEESQPPYMLFQQRLSPCPESHVPCLLRSYYVCTLYCLIEK